MKLKALWMGLQTLLGLRRQGFFIPYRYAAQTASRPDYPALKAYLDARRDSFREHIAAMEEWRDELLAINGRDGAGARQARWTQDWYPRLDAAAAYTMVRRFKPRRIVEIGCGHSTRFLCRAVSDGRLDTAITAIDPAPRAMLEAPSLTRLQTTVQETPATPFTELESGDFLCIDSSHVLMPGSDVDLLLNQVLPALPAGVLVAFHDIFLPEAYPAVWDWRGYNEQNAVAILLQGGYSPLFASHYVKTRMDGELEGSVIAELPLPPGAHESALWLRKN